MCVCVPLHQMPIGAAAFFSFADSNRQLMTSKLDLHIDAGDGGSWEGRIFWVPLGNFRQGERRVYGAK